MGYQDNSIALGNKCTFLELCKCLPLVQVLKISKPYMKFAKGSMQKLPTLLVHFRILFLDVCFLEQDELSDALSVIRSSPNLEKIKIEPCLKHELCYRETCKDLLDLQDYSGINLDHLEELEITSVHNSAPEMEFLKLIMAMSPLLKKTRIKLISDVSMDEENKMLRDLLSTTLHHYLFTIDGDGLYLVVDEKGKFCEDSFQYAFNALVHANDGDKKKDNGKWQKGLVNDRVGEDSDIFKMVKVIIQHRYDPVIIFNFSKRECEFLAMRMTKMDLNEDDEKVNMETIFEFFGHAIR
ncbi:unnamed protein product [Lactuca saligna]|uniref:Uncharacterized protein n=1 Tax=Lactuca saligna TaxID=75948 RepID=A0AA35YRG9_LACSI|nr:unnamed protein product [Lactuca saligna]